MSHVISGMGDYDYLCDVEVDYCYSNPCNNSGECERTEGGYNCKCHQGFAGKYGRVGRGGVGIRGGLLLLQPM